MFYLTTHSTHFIFGYMVSDIWLRTILIVRKETCCCRIGYSFRLTARVLLYAPSHRQDSTYHGLCYTSHGALAGMRNSSMKDRSDDPSHHERMLLPRSDILLCFRELQLYMWDISEGFPARRTVFMTKMDGFHLFRTVYMCKLIFVMQVVIMMTLKHNYYNGQCINFT